MGLKWWVSKGKSCILSCCQAFKMMHVFMCNNNCHDTCLNVWEREEERGGLQMVVDIYRMCFTHWMNSFLSLTLFHGHITITPQCFLLYILYFIIIWLLPRDIQNMLSLGFFFLEKYHWGLGCLNWSLFWGESSFFWFEENWRSKVNTKNQVYYHFVW